MAIGASCAIDARMPKGSTIRRQGDAGPRSATVAIHGSRDHALRLGPACSKHGGLAVLESSHGLAALHPTQNQLEFRHD
jgi:hypothetical protein